ncbi:MAG TPA: phosphatase PAP2 family protein [Spirochaetales bacterium]|nr:phosphatase PAP2 family protein [Spirochaetales bacterium]HRY56509.1 phosphatase PAP2 family protein [Spirochaetia bacterium]HRZ66483.1 phosphatase PAP2 family protein [Spirochaetia bacterium]
MRQSQQSLEPAGLEAQDLITGAAALLFAAFSLVWPDTGVDRLLGLELAHGHLAALGFLVMAFFSLAVAPRIRPSSPLVAFLRRFYPQAYLLAFFSESILLSSIAFGGLSHDPAMAAADQALFGFQPSIEFSRAFSHLPLVNELMFGAYFSYFVIMITTPWLAWFRGGREEARRMVFAQAALFVAVDLFYVFFRVQGPKYWFPELRSAWYGSFEGGAFVAFFQAVFDKAVLSGAAFPSTHVMLTFVSLRFARRIDKRLFAAYLPLAALIVLSTVYIYAHYAVDAIAGILAALALAPLAERAQGPIEELCAKAGQLGAAARR